MYRIVVITSIKEVANLPSLVYLTFEGDKIRSLDGIQGLKIFVL